MNPHPLIRGLAPQASASAYSATRARCLALLQPKACWQRVITIPGAFRARKPERGFGGISSITPKRWMVTRQALPYGLALKFPDLSHLSRVLLNKKPAPVDRSRFFCVPHGVFLCARGDLNPHPLIRGLAPQASASAYSATRARCLALLQPKACWQQVITIHNV